MGRRPQRQLTTNQIQQRQQRSHERHELAHFGGRRLGMGRYWKVTSQTTGSNNQARPITTTDNPTSNARPNNKHDQNEEDTKDDDEQDDNDTLCQLIDN